MERIAQALHMALMDMGEEEARELAASINAFRTGAFRTYGDIKRQNLAAGKLLTAMEEALDITYESMGWKEIEQPQP